MKKMHLLQRKAEVCFNFVVFYLKTPPEGNTPPVDKPSEPGDDPTIPPEDPILPEGPQDRIEADEPGYFKSADTVTEYTGEELNIGLDDIHYGGAQFVGKLFTEGMGRGPIMLLIKNRLSAFFVEFVCLVNEIEGILGNVYCGMTAH